MRNLDLNKTFGVVGVCGANGNLIARILKHRGCNVICSDISSKEDCRFTLEGFEIYYGNTPFEFFDKIDYLIPPLSLSKDNKLFKIASEKNITVLSLYDILDEFLPEKPVLGITGTNGKTTSTTLIKKIAYDNAIIPCEHDLVNMQGNAEFIPTLQSRLPGDVAILEVGTFGAKGSIERTCKYSHMNMGLITNITPDHLSSNFLDYAHVKGEIIENCNKLVVNCQDPTIWGLIKELNFDGELITFGIDWPFQSINPKDCVCGEVMDVKEIISGCGYYFCSCGITTPVSDYIASNIDLENKKFDLFTPEGKIEVKMLLEGLHNVYNVTGAIVAAHEFLKLPFDKILKSVNDFKAVSGRMETIGEVNGKKFIVDYAHNIGGVATILKNFKDSYGDIITINTISSESGEIGDNQILDKLLEYSQYIIATSKASQKVAKERIVDNPELKERIFFSDLDKSFLKEGTSGASYNEVLNGFKLALSFDCDTVVSIGEAGTKFKNCINELI